MLGINGDKGGSRSRICPAIQSRRGVQFWYGLERRERFCVVEPYLYGLLADGEETLLCFQVRGHGGMDVPVGWKLYRPQLMAELLVTNERFTGRRDRTGYNSRRAMYSTIVCQVAPERVEVPEIAAPVAVAAVAPPEPVPPAKGHNELMKRFRLGHWLFPFKGKSRS